jgi:glycosyltransferase involved in cell wall biosynthesis
MGVYNGADTVRAAVESIRTQTFRDWEFVICDDGSNDGTYEVLQQLAHKDDRLVLLQNDRNNGLASALNRCLTVAKGAYIARQDADDLSLPRRLETQVGFLEKHREYAFVSSSMELFDESGIWGRRACKDSPQPDDLLWGNQFCHPATVFRREAVIRVSLYRVAKETRRAEDYDLFLRMYAMGMRGFNLAQPVIQFYEGPLSYKRRKYRYRVDEAIVRLKGFTALGFMPRALPYVVKPLLVGLIPKRFLVWRRRMLDSKRLRELNDEISLP